MDRHKFLVWSRDRTIKYNTAKPEPDFTNAVAEVTTGVSNWLSTGQLNLTAGWLLEQDSRLRPGPVPGGIVPGAVVEVELGVGHHNEYALQHPCVVIRKSGPLLVVVPLTSQGLGQGYTLSAIGELSPEPQDKSKPEHYFMVEFVLPSAKTPSVGLIDQVRTVCESRVKKPWFDGPSRMVIDKGVLEGLETLVSSFTAPSVLSGRSHWKKKYEELVVDFQKTKKQLRDLRSKQVAAGIRDEES